MNCISHPTRAAQGSCARCGHSICEECAVDAKGRLLCKPCVADMAYGSPPPAISGGRRISAGLLFIFSCFFPPGANYMYLGLIKRGLAAMCGFFFIIFMLVVSSARPVTVLLALAIPVLVLTCIFDAFHIRKRIHAGEHVEDGVGNILQGILKNKTLTMVLLVVIAITIGGWVLGVAVRLISALLPTLIILFGLYIIFRKKKDV